MMESHEMRSLSKAILIRRFIESQVNADNVLKALMDANRLGGLEFLKEYCFKFVTKESNYNQVCIETTVLWRV